MIQMEIYKGDRTLWTATITEGGAPLLLTGLTLWFTAKKRAADSDSDAIFQLSIGSGITVTDAAGGIAQIEILPRHTASLPETKVQLVVDFQVVDATGYPQTADDGVLTIKPQVTRRTA